MPDHCPAHEQNTKDLTELKATWSTIKWLWPSVFAVIMALIGAYTTYILSDIKEATNEIKADTKDLKGCVTSALIADAEVRMEVAQLKKDVSDIRLQITRLHTGRGE